MDQFENAAPENGLTLDQLVERDWWSLPNTLAAVDIGVDALKSKILSRGWAEDEINDFVEVAFREALVNAIVHGNYGIHRKGEGGQLKWDQALAATDKEPAGNVEVEISVTSEEIKVSIKDHGEGFKEEEVANPTNLEHKLKPTGRGLAYIRFFADEVSFLEGGTRITIVKRK